VIAKISRDTGIATERTPSLLLLKRTMWNCYLFPPAQQEDSNPSIAEYWGSLKLAHEQNLGNECG
jgi:hypothetical protein